jgi:hypothetical protein
METMDYLNFLYSLKEQERSVFIFRLIFDRPYEEIAFGLHISTHKVFNITKRLEKRRDIFLIKSKLAEMFGISDMLQYNYTDMQTRHISLSNKTHREE